MFKIYNKDALEVMRSFHDKSVDLVLTDPPYDLDESKKAAFHAEMLRVSKGAVIVFAPPENQWVPGADQYLFWVKPISTKNTTKSYSRFVEMIFVYGRGAWDSKRHWSQNTNVFKDLVDGETGHKYEKPLAMMKRLVLNHTTSGQTILDPFMGSGTTGVAALNASRLFHGCEIDKTHYDLAYQRLSALFGVSTPTTR